MKYLDSKHNVIDDTTAKEVKNKIGKKIKNRTEFSEKKKEEEEDKIKLTVKADNVDNIEKEGPEEETKKSFLSITLGKVTLTEKMVLMDNLATMLKAGLALAPALGVLHQETKNKYLRDILIDLQQNVENGLVLSKGMKKYPKVFSDMIVATVEVGESTGMLSDSFAHLAAILKAQRDLQNKIFGALMYPVIVMLALVGVSIFLAFFVFPQLIAIFEQSHVKLPIIMVAVQFILAAIKSYGYYMLGGLFSLIIFITVIFRQPKPKMWLHRVILKVPFVGNLIQEISLTRFAGNLHALLAAGLGIVESLEIVANTLENLTYRKAVLEMATELEKGISLDRAMSDRPNLFPTLTIQLAQVGEKTGELENILVKISGYYDDRVTNVLANLATIIEPVLLILVGLAVGFIAVSIIGPMYELSNSFA